jgi:hypothetical protein
MYDSGWELTDNSMSGTISISGIVRSSSFRPMSRSISISISAAIVSEKAADTIERFQVVLELEVEVCAEGGGLVGRW